MHPSLLPVVLVLALVTPSLVVVDLRQRRLPNPLVALAALGLLVSCLAVLGAGPPGGTGTVLRAVATATATGVVLVALAACGGLGTGDAKLGAVLAGAAALLDPAGPLLAALVAAVCGGVGAVAVAGAPRRRAARAQPGPPPLAVPYGPALLAGWWAVALAETAGGATTVLTIVAPP